MRIPRWTAIELTILAACALAGCARAHPPVPVIASSSAAVANALPSLDWPSYNGDDAEQRFSPLSAINADSIGRLQLAWVADLKSDRGQESTPLVVDGTMYVTTAWSKVVALDAVSGQVKWRYDPQVPGRFGLSACCDVVNRGAAFHKGKVFVGTLDGRLIALEGRSGKLLWSTVTTDNTKPYTITGAPRVVRGKVVIGNGGAEYGVRGYVSAYDESNGKLIWRFYTVPGDPARRDGAASDSVLERLARPTWFGKQYYRYGGGGTVWDSIVYDAELNQLYIGVGNGGPWSRRIRSDDRGDNLFLASIVALNPDTGKYLWHYQETPGDTWDFTSTQQISLTQLNIGGMPRRVLLHAPKNGFFYVIDRTDGKLISAQKFVPVNWAESVDPVSGRPIENPAARFQSKPFLASSGAPGAHNWQPMAYSPLTGLVYIPAQQIPFLYAQDRAFRWKPGLPNLGVDLSTLTAPQTATAAAAMRKSLEGRLIAWDPLRQREVWRVPHEGTWNGGVLATAGNLVFQGLADGTIRAYRADDGRELWRFDAQTPLLAGAMSYAVDGKQYIAIAAGFGSGFALSMPSLGAEKPLPPGRVLVFRLDGTAKLPRLTTALRAPNPANEHWSATAIAAGGRLFAQLCSNCHGLGAQSYGVVPDARRSPALASQAAWRLIVIDGALESRGMVSFRPYLTSKQAEQIRGYVSQQAARLK